MSKRIFDIVFSLIILFLLWWLIAIGWLMACIDTNSNGVFLQKRIGQFGKSFTIYKLKTIPSGGVTVSKIGSFLRRFKIDELPQLINVLHGTMSIVGPRPNVPGYYDSLQGENRNILNLKPGLTSVAAIEYANEEALLATHKNPLNFYDTVIFPHKIQLNLVYFNQHSFWGDIKIILKTLSVVFK